MLSLVIKSNEPSVCVFFTFVEPTWMREIKKKRKRETRKMENREENNNGKVTQSTKWLWAGFEYSLNGFVLARFY